MAFRSQVMLDLLSQAVAHVRAATARAERAETRAARMAEMLDAMAAERDELGDHLERAGTEAAEARATIRGLREQLAAERRVRESVEARAADAELRISRAAEALGSPPPHEAAIGRFSEAPPSAALH